MSGLTEYTVTDIFNYIEKVNEIYMNTSLHCLLFLKPVFDLALLFFFIAPRERVCIEVFSIRDL